MHPALRLRNLEKLPISSRRITTAVCAPHPSGTTVDRFATIFIANPQQLVHFLPVHHHLLDPARIPTAGQLDDYSLELLSTVYAASVAVGTIVGLDIPPEVGVDFWPRLWKWVDFLWTFREFLAREIPMPSEENLSLGLVTFTYRLCEFASNRVLVEATPGFQVFVVRAWASLIQREDFARNLPTAGLFIVHQLLTRYSVLLEERIEGAGGCIDDLARLVMMHVDLVATGEDEPLSSDDAWLLEMVLDIVLVPDGLGSLGPETPLAVGTDLRVSRLCLALGSPSLVKTLTINARNISQAKPQPQHGIVSKGLAILANILKFSRGCSLLRVAIRNGLVPVILAYSQHLGKDVPDANLLQNTLHKLLTTILIPASLHYHVLVDLSDAYFGAENDEEGDFCRPNLRGAWVQFAQLAKSRLDFLRIFDSEEYISQRACDNVECGAILEKDTLKCCSGCRMLLYCSQECQKAEWHLGHRRSCVWYLSRRSTFRLDYTSRESAFMRAQIHLDYRRMRGQIYNLCVKEWAIDPDTPLYVMFDYRFGAPTVSVHVFKEEAGHDPVRILYWSDLVARESRSAGRISLHIMRVYEGAGQRDTVIPLRRVTSKIPDALKRIAADAGSLDPGQVEEQIRSLLDQDVLADIH
ncbi:hypothetical protein DFH06DRAFT_1445395 [Mycena polygramma]|nr:hypothetical protein DFH06DRAFT_1445395 [Mycena polygramma]